ncbi:MAG: hypothetical protein A2Y62_02135 [Candidatus Fischerbacteria bacterium RBG_13_37_8]|uniref:Uncharacterized protein n=1 Tax=Candidatus Fischerbacteria bacterium RBG_13_37_8 TaxID=1817863 RepID=A0A1F5VJM4_9BACT|nr:MAG: hypothetical protein A2Y62_02135 [Candidatus Fischerbacteria bacterium RBG_13_37_8]
MRINISFILSIIVALACFLIANSANYVYCHCDTMDGPVIQAAKKALETGDVSLVLIWVQKDDETAIRKAFERTIAVRKLNAEAKEFADMYFFETLVRIHRAGEGFPYTGIEPAGTDVGPAVSAADKALETGSREKLINFISDEIKHGIEKHFKEALEKKNYKKDDISAGREYVKAYVEYVHYVEKIYESTKSAGHEHSHGHEAEELPESK